MLRWLVAGFVCLIPLVLQAQGPSRRPDWFITIGAMTLAMPRYPGSHEYRLLPFPMINVVFRDRVYLAPSMVGQGIALGGFPVRTRSATVALELSRLDSRPASRADALAGLDDRDAVFAAGAGLSARAGPVELGAGLTRGLNDGAGTIATGRISLSRMLGRLGVTLTAGAVVADSRQMRREFGISPKEAERRRQLLEAGDPRLRPGDGIEYRPSGGLRHVAGSMSLMYPLTQRWTVLGFGGLERLGDDPAASPLVRERVQPFGGAGLWFRL